MVDRAMHNPMSSDIAWEQWGRQDPYFGVLTHERFRRDKLDAGAKHEFFTSGETHVSLLLSRCRALFGALPEPLSVLDFGCGVGRLLVPFKRAAERVVGVDVSPSMLAEARRNCDELEAAAVELALSDDALSQVDGRFALVHSSIVLQHIDPHRGLRIIEALLSRVMDGGIAALHLTYAKAWHADTYGQPPAPPPMAPPALTAARGWLRRLGRDQPSAAVLVPAPALAPGADPEMQMHAYNLSEVLFMFQRRGASGLHVDFSDHGGELGVTLYARFGEPEAAVAERRNEVAQGTEP